MFGPSKDVVKYVCDMNIDFTHGGGYYKGAYNFLMLYEGSKCRTGLNFREKYNSRRRS